ncbi:peptidylprolyl isomerase [bacterium]|jgi:peptidyl-prolyl cis-trans isomerase B (cyclophilin B)|nr:peptidylprolyl isomerase [bacterium]MBT3581788.1 peptidylprolyl isomerase [bacterium]MBT4552478.1 peptidylprolyl isomerase [bacterium]MBT5988224.1 peptidylprolyl isomerase [bacterium]MBT7087504.1 peptidylprolyl isomerase [bacterium]
MSNEKNPIVKMELEIKHEKKPITGEIMIELLAKEAPESVKNFLGYVEDGFYNGTIFHRVISNFMIQGGGFESGLKEKENKAPIKNEADNGVNNKIGTLAMARTQIVDSATSQFFINVNDNDFLNHQNTSPQGYGYAVFGKVIEGMDLVNKIKNVDTTSVSHYDDVPVDDVVIKNVTLL